MKRTGLKALSLFLSAVFSISVAFAGYMVINDAVTKSASVSTDSAFPVAYNTSTGVYYSTIEKALDDASSGQQVNVIQGTDPTITRDCEIKSGVILNLPPTVTVTPSLAFSDWSSSTSSGKVTLTLKKGGLDYLTWIGTYSLKSSTVEASRKASCSRSLHGGTYSDSVSVTAYSLTLKFSESNCAGSESSVSVSATSGVTCEGSGSGECKFNLFSCTASENSWDTAPTYTYTYSYSISIAVPLSAKDANNGSSTSAKSSLTFKHSEESKSVVSSLSGSSMGEWTSDTLSLVTPDYSTVSNYGTSQIYINSLAGASTLSVFVEDGVTVTNNGTVYVGGTIAAGNGSTTANTYSGHTYGAYAEVVLGKNAKFQNNGALNVYGYIKEETKENGSELDNASGSSVLVPFVVRDFKGGALTVSCYNSKGKLYAFPFNQYEVRNISVRAFYRYGSSLSGMADLYANSTHNITTMGIISSSSDSFIQLTDASGYAEAKFTESDSYSSSPTGKGSCSLDIYGGCTFNSMSLTVSLSGISRTVSSSDFYYPVSWRYNVGLYKLSTQESATYTASDRYSFLPGASLTVGEGAILSAGSLVFYKEWPSSVSTTYDSSKEPTSSTVVSTYRLYYYTASEKRDAAYLMDNGTVTASTFSGLLKSSVAGSTINITGSYSSENYQPLSVDSDAKLAILAGSDENTYMKIENTATYSDESTNISSTGTYTSTSSGFFAS